MKSARLFLHRDIIVIMFVVGINEPLVGGNVPQLVYFIEKILHHTLVGNEYLLSARRFYMYMLLGLSKLHDK